MSFKASVLQSQCLDFRVCSIDLILECENILYYCGIQRTRKEAVRVRGV